MITLHRAGDPKLCDAVEDRLKDLVLAHHVVPAGGNGPGGEPSITEGSTIYRGLDEIMSLLDEIEAEVGFSRQISADACYINPDDPTRCI